MRKRRLFLGLIGVALLVGVLAVVIKPEPEAEPEYKGKKLSEWILPPTGSPMELGSTQSNPIRQIGTNAIPCLLKWIRYEVPAWKKKFYPVLEKLLGKNSHWSIREDRRFRLTDASVFAFGVLGPEAKAAIPGLGQILNEPKRTTSAGNAAAALLSLGGDAELASSLTNKNCDERIRIYVINLLSMTGSSMRTALVKTLEDESPDIRKAATNAIRVIDARASQTR